jgi:hypothetical protein
MEPRDTVGRYYDALRNGEPLGRFFLDGPDVVKVGISERLVGTPAVREGLATQTETTTDWAVESHDLRVRRHDDAAAFADAVSLAWTATEQGIRYEFDTRWSGTLVRDEGGDRPTGWAFAGMHVSTAGQL